MSISIAFRFARGLKPALLACAGAVALMSTPALAQQVDANRLLELMVQKGLVTREEADGMIAEASRAQPSVQPALPPVPAGGVDAQGVQTIPYVPAVVREQIKAELKAELGSQAQAQGWAAPGQTPDWTRRIQIYGDVRVRGEGRFYDAGNADIFTDYAAINAGDPQNINDKTPGWIAPPFLNSLEDRQRAQVRARLGVKARINDWIGADVRLATGSDRSPVSTNQTLGANGGAGYQVWLDRASIRLTPVEGVAADFGRFANPFWAGELIYDADLNFDGAAISAERRMNETVSLFATAGAFPVFNTDLNFGSRNAPTGSLSNGPFKSQDRYLMAVQGGAAFKATETLELKFAAGYFHYQNLKGEISMPCQFYELVCSTDATRPAFQQHGNTLFPIRSVIADPLDPVASPENQYFGLASDFRILHLRAAADYRSSERFGLRLDGEYVKNLGWNESDVAALAINNLGPDIRVPDPANPGQTIRADGPYEGGDTGWQTRLTMGSVLNLNGEGDWSAKRGDWNAFVGYRHLESDAVVDAFADSDFHIGGTNKKGWMVGGHYAVGDNTVIGGRWISADEVADAPFSVDRLLIDLLTRF